MIPSESVSSTSRRSSPARDLARFPHPGYALDDVASDIMESFPGYVAVLDAANTVISANRAWLELHEARGTQSIASAGIGESYLAGVRAGIGEGEDATRITTLLETARGSDAVAEPVVVHSPDDRQLRLSARRVRGGSSLVVTCVDISEWASSERALHQAQRDLIAAAQLATAGELVGGIAHDLRQPLAAVEMNVAVAAHLLRQTPPESASALVALDDAMEGANVLRESVQVLQDLVARREPAFNDVSIVDVIDDVIRLVQAEANARGLGIERLVPSPDRLPRMQADASMLREAILSLLLDAVENADARAPDARVLVSARLVDDRIELVVHHTTQSGPSQVSAWARSVARSVAEAHGASMSVDIDAVFGTTVRTLWPAVRVSQGQLE